MNDFAKTSVFVALAAAFSLIAWVARPAPPQRQSLDDAGQRFFVSFDPLTAASLDIVVFDQDTASVRPFSVARVNGVWSIPSHENYPADSQNQLATVAAGFVDLIKGPTISDRPADHELFGVIDPVDAPVGATGVGTRLTMKDANSRTLVDLIIGKEQRGQQSLRYVRLPGKDRVYTCAVPTAKLSTKFDDWIERNLLKFDPNQLTGVVLKDYSIDELNQRLIQGRTLQLAYDSKARQWNLGDIVGDEQLDSAKLETLKQALSDLSIISVHRKPAGLSHELKATDQMRLDAEARESLANKGYYISNGQLLSNEGETIVTLSSGVQYVLRFGEIALGETGSSALADSENPAPAESSNGRYLFITADFNEQAIPQPIYQPMPPITDIQKSSGENPEEGTATADDSKAELEKMLEEAKKKVEADNQRLREGYEKSIADGKKKVQELNDHFADWYYVISDGVYQKIRLKRDQIVSKKDATAPTTSAPDQPPLILQPPQP